MWLLAVEQTRGCRSRMSFSGPLRGANKMFRVYFKSGNIRFMEIYVRPRERESRDATCESDASGSDLILFYSDFIKTFNIMQKYNFDLPMFYLEKG